MCRHVAQPPSAVVKFFTAWNEKLLKSATLPVGVPLYEAPKECAQSATIGISFLLQWNANDRSHKGPLQYLLEL